MNTTTLASGTVSSQDLHSTIGGAFFGFTLGAILFGITIRQAYQYYTINVNDSVFRKSLIAVICLLDLMNLLFGVYMIYSFILLLVGYTDLGHTVTWSLKALAGVQVVIVVIVQHFYLSQIWRLSKNLLLLSQKLILVVQFFVGFAAIYALAIGIFIVQELSKITTIIGFSPEIESVVYIGFGSTAFLDCSIAAAMCLILYRSNGGTRRTESVVETLIQYFIGTGLLTSFSAIVCIILYVVQPSTLLYLGMEFSVTRLYANSILAMFNARRQLRDKLAEPLELELPSNILFKEPESITQNLLMHSNPFSASADTKYSEGRFSTEGRS
jgi:hypothetical protein